MCNQDQLLVAQLLVSMPGQGCLHFSVLEAECITFLLTCDYAAAAVWASAAMPAPVGLREETISTTRGSLVT